MSKRSDLNARVHALGEIKSILGAMKNLSIIEMNKVSRYLGSQNELAHTIEEVLIDYEASFGAGRLSKEASQMVYILVGSERGFCGGFNEAVIERLSEIEPKKEVSLDVIAVGRKLASKLTSRPGASEILEIVEGASAAEEIAASISALLACLARYPKAIWTLVYHDSSGTQSQVAVVCPFDSKHEKNHDHGRSPPLLNLPPSELYPQLIEQYLFSVLYKAFYLSFLAENRQRLRHMDGALNALERDWNQMRRQSNTLRQEEITEELEVIMLSAEV